ncbi:MAG: arsenical pump-driving ATPase [Planctomycetales bacterium]|nr:arsenical pump-driving ATPase [Planctomycetales bacterium]
MQFLTAPTRNLFFTGKGGVGKTSVACATAVKLADRGHRVLLVSTDPASNLDEVLQVHLGNTPTQVPAAANLWAMNIDPQQAARAYRERMVGPYRGILPDAAIQSMEEQLSGSCTVEIAAFDEFAKLLGNSEATAEFHHVIFDTAPTGHTLRLLTLPSAWSGFMETNTSGTSCLGPLAGLQSQQALYQQTVRSLGDRDQTTLLLVARHELSSLREADRTHRELFELGVHNQHLVLNGLFHATDPHDPIAAAMQSRCDRAITDMPRQLRELGCTSIPLSSHELLGIEALRNLADNKANISGSSPSVFSRTQIAQPTINVQTAQPLAQLIDEFAHRGRGVILTMGKGGVGKTTLAAAISVAIAERGIRVHLTTTDPAAHVAAALNADSLPELSIDRIDPAEVTSSYRDEVMQTAGAELDEQGRALLNEDLRSPCTEEIAVFRAFAEAVASADDRFVVLDTAPTGHTILLLDSALAYHREVTRQSTQMPASVEQLLPRLRNPEYTHVLIVTLPESTPVHEAAQLQTDLRRAEIEPFAWVVNQALSPLSVTDPLLRCRQACESPLIAEVQTGHARRTVIIPWQQEPPVGVAALHDFVRTSQD